jgi:peptidyl-prolyl cis-trans isomerase D
VAEAYFSAAQGGVTVPAQGPLGWHIARVSNVNQRSAQSLADVSDEIAARLREEKRQRGIAELAIGIEDRLADGASLSAVADELDLELQTTPPITAQGMVYGTPQPAPAILAPVINFAFQIDEGQAEIGALPDQQTFLIYEVTDITTSAAAPLAEIRDMAIAAWRAERASVAAKAAADRIVSRVEAGESLAVAVAAEEVDLRAPEQVSFSREQLAQLGNQRVPTPIALMFGMAEGSVKRLEGNRERAWFVVDLEDITLEELAEDDPLISLAQSQVGQAWGSEYAEQLLAAMRTQVGVERNADAIAAVRRQLLGVPN